MDIGISRWERRDGADRDQLGKAALGFCRAMRGSDGVQNARFYWTNPDTVVVLTEADTSEILYRQASPEVTRATFVLADLARQTATETLFDARTAEATFRAAQA